MVSSQHTPTERGGTGGVERRYGGRGAAVWCGVVLENPPSLRSYARATFFFFLLLLPNEGGGGGGSGFASAEKGGAGGRVERLPAVSGHGTPALEPRRTGPPRTKNHRTPLVGHACTPARANARYPPTPAPPPFAADEWTYAFSCMFYLY